jgi:hypothetical protein
MSRNAKLIIGIIGSFVVLCLCAGVLAFFVFRSATPLLEQAVSMTEDAAEVAAIASGIVDYSLPAGYQEAFGMSFFNFDIVAFSSSASRRHMIMLMQMPPGAGLDQADMERQMEQSLQQQMGRRNYRVQVVDEITTTIRDQPVTLTVSEGTDDEGTAIRQVAGVFEGKNGVVLLMIMGPQQGWDQAGIDAFIASLR